MLKNLFDRYDLEKRYIIWGDDDSIEIRNEDEYVRINHKDIGDESLGFLNLTLEQALILSDVLKNILELDFKNE